MPKSNEIYLDYAASISANPSSIHSLGVDAKKKLENARGEVANILGARTFEVIFTSGGTESNNLAIQGVVLASFSKKLPHIITTNIEHSSVLETFKLLAKRKIARISIIGVEINGIVDPKKIKKQIRKDTMLISVNYANNEIGTIQPLKEIAKEIRHYKKINKRKNIFFHTDAVQTANYLDLNVEKLGVDMLTLSGSKIEDAGRIGVLFKKECVSLANIFGGGDQEGGMRPGTENLPEILKFSAALKSAQKIKEKEYRRLIKLRDYFFKKLLKLKNQNFNFLVNGDLKNRLPNNVNITVPNIPSDLLVIELSARGIMASAKSACKAGDGKASYVIKAINKNIKETDGSLRFSLGRQTTKNDINYTVKALSEILTKLKKWYN
ncbi:MAG: Cysteine desulfurase [Candidatus Nomurabacteria bacterium GW2011_GWA1_37_20]|uniref:Cysteine desulfurase n=2 Tax=Parcubacteria group TaxID=1794811 RepID=A0A0G0HUB6_9BACT|nr:MAG: Cysteine desulfurase [Parcubacteria group bacterium GW2011_GWC1_36_9]KKQ27486.1 MAG: Cysteine desulfurase [Parcubacteria group bacterium GW2011_GWB1_37_13]KKQ33695.1 MAG: Cysteine desulfurase [Candidatus Nomurabacteria bacterium GW2011_GWA1_37_20]KKQ46733.1 MAG: Cysteine desulfurase [Candidatus Yanofskybacteria bacterium GW2011_GWC2_37_9]